MTAKPPTAEEQRLLNIIYKRNWEVDQRATDITQLKADLADRVGSLDDAYTKIVEIKADLAKFGGHTAGCAYTKFVELIVQDDYARTPPGMSDKCNCGYAEAKERWE